MQKNLDVKNKFNTKRLLTIITSISLVIIIFVGTLIPVNAGQSLLGRMLDYLNVPNASLTTDYILSGNTFKNYKNFDLASFINKGSDYKSFCNSFVDDVGFSYKSNLNLNQFNQLLLGANFANPELASYFQNPNLKINSSTEFSDDKSEIVKQKINFSVDSQLKVKEFTTYILSQISLSESDKNLIFSNIQDLDIKTKINLDSSDKDSYLNLENTSVKYGDFNFGFGNDKWVSLNEIYKTSEPTSNFVKANEAKAKYINSLLNQKISSLVSTSSITKISDSFCNAISDINVQQAKEITFMENGKKVVRPIVVSYRSDLSKYIVDELVDIIITLNNDEKFIDTIYNAQLEFEKIDKEFGIPTNSREIKRENIKMSDDDIKVLENGKPSAEFLENIKFSDTTFYVDMTDYSIYGLTSKVNLTLTEDLIRSNLYLINDANLNDTLKDQLKEGFEFTISAGVLDDSRANFKEVDKSKVTDISSFSEDLSKQIPLFNTPVEQTVVEPDYFTSTDLDSISQ
jgi:hypothetical protein